MIRTTCIIFLVFLATIAGEAGLSAQVTVNTLRQNTVPKVITYKTVADTTLKLFVFTPEDFVPGVSRTAVVWIHGGGWGSGKPDMFFPHCRYFATRGAVAISVQYRLVKSGATTMFDCIRDCKSAIRYIRAHAGELGVNPNCIAVMGDSAGGHLAACLGVMDTFDEPGDDLTVSAVPNAMVLYNPVMNLAVEKWMKLFTPTDTMKEEQLARSASPLNYIGEGKPPAIVLHGYDDTVVPVNQAIEFTRSMAEHGNRCDLVLYGKTGHAFVVIDYMAPDAMVARAIRAGDDFLVSLGMLSGQPTLTVDDK
jgi:acetyl esterase/lipase